MSLASILMLIESVKRFAELGASWLTLLIAAAGLTIGVLFVRRQRRSVNPLIDLELFRYPRLVAALALYLLATFIAFGLYIFINQYLQHVAGLSPLGAGLWTLPWSFGFIAGTLLVPKMAKRIRPAPLMSSGLALAAAGLLSVTKIDVPHGLATLAVAQMLLALGTSPVVTLCTDIIIGTAPAERAGAAAAISETFGELGGVLGISIIGSVGVLLYRLGMRDAPPAARATLGGAIAVARTLPHTSALALIDDARTAFVHMMRCVAWIEAGIVLLMVGLTWGALRER
jgi:DHA2 family multidrug resistance protein-like MFS transporter